MTLKEVYDKINGDYNGVIHRLMDEKRVKKFLLKFPVDTSFADLRKALESGDCDMAFRAAHTLKGVCQNLGITVLFESSNELTEHLRGGNLEGSDELFEKVAKDYDDTVRAISSLTD